MSRSGWYKRGYDKAKEDIKEIVRKQLIDVDKLRNPEETFTITNKQAIKDFNGELKYILQKIEEL